jgi:hypothetical protein
MYKAGDGTGNMRSIASALFVVGACSCLPPDYLAVARVIVGISAAASYPLNALFFAVMKAAEHEVLGGASPSLC